MNKRRAPSQRQLRVGEELRHALARILARDELRDPALVGAQVTVTEVRVGPDLRSATAYVTPLGGGDAGRLVAALRHAAPYLRGRIADEVRLRFAPTIQFEADPSFDRAGRIERLLREPAVARDLEGEAAAAAAAATMARKRRGLPIHGWLVLDKPLGMTSTQAVTAVRRALDAAKAGHGGTLDPLATGVLPIALGEATKTVSHVMDGAKTYRFTVRWGEARDTDDAEGEVVATSARRPSEAEIQAVLPEFVGTVSQVPPIFSALKIGGARAYDLARAKAAVELAPRPVRIDRLELIGRPDADRAEFEARSGKGAYMRSLARDLALRLGTVGHIAALRRTAAGPFTEEQAISLESLISLGHSAAAVGAPSGPLLAVETALDDIPALALTAAEANRLRCGQSVGLIHRVDRERVGHLASGSLVCAMSGGKPVALARFEAGDLRPVRVLHL